MLALTENSSSFYLFVDGEGGGGDNAEKKSSTAITDGSNNAEDEYSVKGYTRNSALTLNGPSRYLEWVVFSF